MTVCVWPASTVPIHRGAAGLFGGGRPGRPFYAHLRLLAQGPQGMLASATRKGLFHAVCLSVVHRQFAHELHQRSSSALLCTRCGTCCSRCWRADMNTTNSPSLHVSFSFFPERLFLQLRDCVLGTRIFGACAHLAQHARPPAGACITRSCAYTCGCVRTKVGKPGFAVLHLAF